LSNYRVSGGGAFPGCDGTSVAIEAPDANPDVLLKHICQRRFGLERGRSRRRAGLERFDAAAGKVAALQAHRILANVERFGNVRARPTRQRQQQGARPIRPAAIARDRKPAQSRLLLRARRHRRFARHVPPLADQRENGITAGIRWLAR